MFWHPLGYTSHSHTPSSWTCNWPLWNLHQSSPCCNYLYAIRFGSNPTRASRPRSSKLILSNSRGESCQSSWTAAQFSRMFWVDLAGLLHWCKLNILKQWPFHLKGKVLSLSNFSWENTILLFCLKGASSVYLKPQKMLHASSTNWHIFDSAIFYGEQVVFWTSHVPFDLQWNLMLQRPGANSEMLTDWMQLV